MQFRNAIYVNDEHTCFDVDVTLDDNTQIPYTFTIGGYDDAPISMAIKEAMGRGEIQIADYVPPVIPDEVLAFDIRDKRNALLSATDYLLQVFIKKRISSLIANLVMDYRLYAFCPIQNLTVIQIYYNKPVITQRGILSPPYVCNNLF